MSNIQSTRPPVMAGRFYEADTAACRREAQQLCDSAVELPDDLPATLHGAVVPHAGWICSGRIAATALRVLHEHTDAKTLLITGSVHTVDLRGPALDASAQWQTPLGEVPVDADLRQAIAGLDGFDVIDRAHTQEHSIEVELPFVQLLWGADVKFVPCMIPPNDRAAAWGQRLGDLLADWSAPVAMVCSVDLTHYGPNYGFAPAGVGTDGYQWAHQVNDRQLIDMMTRMDGEHVVEETAVNRNSCGGGAIAATLAACRRMGASRGVLIEQTDSTRELAKAGYRRDVNSVGYAGMVFG